MWQGNMLDSILAALANIDDGVIVVSGGRLVEYINKAAEAIFGPIPHNGASLTFIEVVRDYECDSLLRRCMETGHAQSAVIRMHPDNKLVHVTIVPDGTRKHYIAVMQDLTERQHLEDIRRDLISNISHEFRTPIASIKLLSETLIDGASHDPKTMHDFLKKIAVEADKLAQMTDDLKELSAIEKGGSVLHKGATDIRRMIEQVARRLEAQARARELQIETSADTGLPRPVIDRDRVESVLVNLIHNAIKFTGPGGKITVRAAKENDNILVSVADTGKGIAVHEMNRIFERFYKVDKSRVGEGSGLGLSISKHIIAAHGGRIWVESQEGRGSTFYFTLPLSSQA
jgi:two-component system, OmpR family, phosphate regulon sensor histidine kinase PhoR